jgi:prophage DNA circulation protein
MSVTKNWKDNLQQASFQGIPFEIEGHSAEFGRRIVSHAFPFRDKPYNEDLGKKQRTLQVTGFLVGENYFAIRDKLIAAIEKGKSGELVHPYLGTMQVECATLSVSENFNKGRYCTLNFTFIESGANSPLKVLENKAAKVQALFSAVHGAGLQSFGKNFTSLAGTSKYLQQVLQALNSVMQGFNNAERAVTSIPILGADMAYIFNKIRQKMTRSSMSGGDLGNVLWGCFAALKVSLTGKASDPEKQAVATLTPRYAMPGMFYSVQHHSLAAAEEERFFTAIQKAERVQKRILAFKILFYLRLSEKRRNVWRTSEARRAERNILELETLLQIFIMCAWCDFAMGATFLSVNEVNKARDDIAEALDALMNRPLLDDTLYLMLYQLRSFVYETLNSVANELPVMKSIVVRYPQTLLHFCFEQFGNLNKESEILYLNNIKNPDFLYKGQLIKVIA